LRELASTRGESWLVRDCRTSKSALLSMKLGGGLWTVYIGALLGLGVRWYTVVYILDVYIECLPRVG